MFLWNDCRSRGTFRDKLGVFKRLFLKDLIDAAKEYAHHSNRSLSKIAEDYLRSVLKIKEEVISLLHF
jgi:hypothetical protein